MRSTFSTGVDGLLTGVAAISSLFLFVIAVLFTPIPSSRWSSAGIDGRGVQNLAV